MMMKRLRCVLVMVAAGGWCAGCSKEQPSGSAGSSAKNERAGDSQVMQTAWRHPAAKAYVDAGYVPDEACITCHSDIWKTYQHVGMAQSFYKPPAEDDAVRNIEDFSSLPFHHTLSNRYYTMERRDGVLHQVQYQMDLEGRQINAISQRVDYVIGSGSNVRTYLYRNAAGEMYQLPLAWYSRTNSWGMNPGYDVPTHHGFSRQVTRDCLFCHNAYPDSAIGADMVGQPQVFPEILPEGIGCQRCHGPGAEHVRLANDLNVSDEAVRGSMLRLADFTPQQKDDLCYQCHLQPSVSFNSLQGRLGRGMFSYRPGEPLDSFVFHIDLASREMGDRFEINHHAYRMMQSPCRMDDGRALSCLTCHDPHVKVGPEEKIGHYRAACLQCHAMEDCGPAIAERAAHSEEAVDCVTCHMPRRRPHDVIQATMTDHKIVKIAEPAEKRLAILKEFEVAVNGTPAAVFPAVTESGPGGAERELLLAMVGVERPNAMTLGRLRDLVKEYQPASPDPYAVLAVHQLRNGLVQEALAALDNLVQRFPDLALAHTHRGLALQVMGRDAEAKVSFERALRLEAANPSPEALLGLGDCLFQMGDTTGAKAAIERSIALRPHYGQAHMSLASVHQFTGNMQEAERQYRLAMAAQPGIAEPFVRLGMVLNATGRAAEAEGIWSLGLASTPAQPSLLTCLGIAALDKGEWKNALEVTDLVGAMQGADPVAVMMLRALALAGLKRDAEAQRAMAEAMRLSQQVPPPDSPFPREMLRERVQRGR